jgi:outer membrane protein assembly factor BamB
MAGGSDTNTDPGTERWRVPLDGGAGSPPTVADDTVYVHTDGGTVHAVDGQTGETAWQAEVGVADATRPAVAGERVYATGTGALCALDRATGEERWQFTFDGEATAAPSVVDGTVYLGLVDGTAGDGSSALYAIDTVDGAEQWCVRNGSATAPNPTVVNGIVYVAGAGGGRAVAALDAKTGSELWRFEVGTDSTVHAGGTDAPPRVAAELVFGCSEDGHLYAIDARDGTERWRFRGDSGTFSPPVVADGTVYVASGETLHAVDPETGRERWYLRLGGEVRSALRVAAGTVYGCTDDGTVLAVDAATGRGRWRFRSGAPPRGVPLYRDGAVYVASGDTLHAIDAGTGTPRWDLSTDERISAAPTLVDGTLYIASRDGVLSAVAVDPSHRKAPSGTHPDATLYTFDGVDVGNATALRTAGYGTPQALRAAAGHELAAVPGVGWDTAARIKTAVGSRAADSTDSDADSGDSQEDRRRNVDVDAPDSDLGPGEECWRFATDGQVRSSPIVSGRTVYLGGTDLRAVDLVDGVERWRFENTFETEQFLATPALADGIVYAGSADGYLYAVDARDGTDLWRHGIGGAVENALAVADGTVYASTDALHAVDAETGEERWRFEPGSRVSGSPAVADGTVFVGTSQGRLYAVDRDTGSGDVVFDSNDEYGVARFASPAVADSAVFVGSDMGRIHAIDPETAAELWSCYTEGKITSRPTVVDGTVYMGDRVRRLYAIDATTGAERWHFEAPDLLNAGTHAAPTVAGGTVYTGSGDTLYAVDAETGGERWHVETGGDVRTTPAVADRRVVFGSDDGTLYAVAAER